MSLRDRVENGGITRRSAFRMLPATVAGLLAATAVPRDGAPATPLGRLVAPEPALAAVPQLSYVMGNNGPASNRTVPTFMNIPQVSWNDPRVDHDPIVCFERSAGACWIDTANWYKTSEPVTHLCLFKDFTPSSKSPGLLLPFDDPWNNHPRTDPVYYIAWRRVGTWKRRPVGVQMIVSDGAPINRYNSDNIDQRWITWLHWPCFNGHYHFMTVCGTFNPAYAISASIAGLFDVKITYRFFYTDDFRGEGGGSARAKDPATSYISFDGNAALYVNPSQLTYDYGGREFYSPNWDDWQVWDTGGSSLGGSPAIFWGTGHTSGRWVVGNKVSTQASECSASILFTKGTTVSGWRGDPAGFDIYISDIGSPFPLPMTFDANAAACGGRARLTVLDGSIRTLSSTAASARLVYNTSNYYTLGLHASAEHYDFLGWYSEREGGDLVWSPWRSEGQSWSGDAAICVPNGRFWANDGGGDADWHWTWEGGPRTFYAHWRPQHLVRCEDWWVDVQGNRRAKLRDAGQAWYSEGQTARGTDWGASFDNNTYVGCTEAKVTADGLVVYRHWKVWVDLNLYTPDGLQSYADGNRVWCTLQNSNGTFSRLYNEPGNPNSSYFYGETARVCAAGTSESRWCLRGHSANLSPEGRDVGDANSLDYGSFAWRSVITTTAPLELRWASESRVRYFVDGADAAHLAFTEHAWDGESYAVKADYVRTLALPNGRKVVRPGCTPGFAGFFLDRAAALGAAAPAASPVGSVHVSGDVDLYAANRCTLSFAYADGSVVREGSDVRVSPGGAHAGAAATALPPARVGAVERAVPLASVNRAATIEAANDARWVMWDAATGRWRTLRFAGWKLDDPGWDASLEPDPACPMDRDRTAYGLWVFREADGVETGRAL